MTKIEAGSRAQAIYRDKACVELLTYFLSFNHANKMMTWPQYERTVGGTPEGKKFIFRQSDLEEMLRSMSEEHRAQNIREYCAVRARVGRKLGDGWR